MRQDIRLGRVAGVAVGANWTVGVILVLIGWLLGASVLPGAVPHQAHGLYWSAAVAGAVLFLASLLAHETAHAVVARRNGVRVRSITLWMLGGIAELEGEPPDAGADLRIALAGPATSTLAAGVFLGAAALPGAVGAAAVAVAAAQWLAVMNGLLAAFNLLPGAPLDGGRALRALLWRHYGDRRRAEATAARAGQFLGAAVTAFGVFELLAWRSFGGLWLVLAGWFLLAAASTEQQAAVAAAALAGVRIADIQTADPGLAPGWSTVRDFIDTAARRSRQNAFPDVDVHGRAHRPDHRRPARQHPARRPRPGAARPGRAGRSAGVPGRAHRPGRAAAYPPPAGRPDPGGGAGERPGGRPGDHRGSAAGSAARQAHHRERLTPSRPASRRGRDAGPGRRAGARRQPHHPSGAVAQWSPWTAGW